ncbi:MAG: hypothetical protein QW416_03760 [Candidatus Nitrosocaldaceae archaeon]
MSRDDSKLKRIYLEDIIQSITSSIVNSKLLIDKRVNEVRKDYEIDEFMRSLPINVFEISEVDVELRFVIDKVEKDDSNKVIIDTNKVFYCISTLIIHCKIQDHRKTFNRISS